MIEAMGGWAGRHQNWRNKGVALLDRVGGKVGASLQKYQSLGGAGDTRDGGNKVGGDHQHGGGGGP